MHIEKNHKSGFTLIELAIVMVIGGILLSAFLQLSSIEQKKKRYDITKERINSIRTSLTLYAIRNGNLPCPESPSEDSGDPCATVGLDSKPNGAKNSTPKAADSPGDIRIGILPMKELRLDRSQIQDGWGNKFTYAVSHKLTLPNGMRGNPVPLGVISIVDEKGESVLDKPDTGRYVVISHGPTGAGAWLSDGGRRACNEDTVDGKNCMDLNAFVVAPVSDQPGKNFYDDIVIHDDHNAGGPLIDSLAICSAKQGFYEPLNPHADQDGCTLSRPRLR